MEVFWAHGFEATTMTDLQQALGIGRQSLYATFGDKQQLFVEALDRYVQMSDAVLAERFGPNAGLDEIRSHLHEAATRLTVGEPRSGCLIMNTCIERAPHDAQIAAVTERGLASVRHAFARALANSRDRGELSLSGETHVMATFLTSQLAGLAVLARAGASTAELIQIADTALSSLESPTEAP